jgi:hypothetical protein
MLICNYWGHNRRRQSLTGAVHYCSRCGIVTRDNRKHKLPLVDARMFYVGTRVIFGSVQEYSSLVVEVDYVNNVVTVADGRAYPKWRSKLVRTGTAIKEFFSRQLFRLLQALGIY